MFAFLYFIAFVSNADVSPQLVFGKDMNTWLLFTLLFLGLTMLGFGWVWLIGFIRERDNSDSTQSPSE